MTRNEKRMFAIVFVLLAIFSLAPAFAAII